MLNKVRAEGQLVRRETPTECLVLLPKHGTAPNTFRTPRLLGVMFYAQMFLNVIKLKAPFSMLFV